MKHKVLSVKQPWAFLICSGIKDIENRTWKCPQKYIGERVLIHASAKPENIKLDIEGQATVKEIKLLTALNYCDENELYSAIIGSVEIVDCVINHPSIWAEKSTPIELDEFGFPIKYDKKIYNWVVEDPILFEKPIINVKGKLNFWIYDLKNILCPVCGNPAHTQFLGDVVTDAFCMKCGKQCYRREFKYMGGNK